MYIQVRIENKDLIALVDTGASGVAFVSESLCQRLNLPHQVISPPISLTGFEGGRESLITSKTSFKLAIGRHLEKLSAFVISRCKYDLILGLPWLELHNPYIDWKENTITFGETCLKKKLLSV